MILSGAFVAALVLLLHLQPRIMLNRGAGFDGRIYARMAQQIARGELPSAKAPYVMRVGFPAAAGAVHLLLGNDVVDAAFVFGPILWLLCLAPARARAILHGQPALSSYLAFTALIACVGGTDIDRFLFWAFPVVYLLCARIWGELPIARGIRAATVGLMLLAQRPYFAIPHRIGEGTSELCRQRSLCPPYSPSPTPILAFQTSDYQLLDLHPFWGTPYFIMMAFGQHVACVALLTLAQSVVTRRATRAPS